jgi:hypothetical protein
MACCSNEFLPEIDLPGDRIVGDLAGGSGDEDLAAVEDVRAVRDGQRLAHVVIGDEDADAPVAKARDDLLDVRDGDGVDARERLVQQQVLR